MGLIEEAEARGDAVTPEGLWYEDEYRDLPDPVLVQFGAPAPADDFLQWLDDAAERVRDAVQSAELAEAMATLRSARPEWPGILGMSGPPRFVWFEDEQL